MENLMSTFSDRQGDLVQLLLEHVQISMIALFVAILLAVPFAIFVVKYKKASEVTLQLAGILQTIPSLALLGLFIPFLGIGKVPAIVANGYGDGRTVYVGCRLGRQGLAKSLPAMLGSMGLSDLAGDGRVLRVERADAAAANHFEFVFNRTHEPVTVDVEGEAIAASLAHVDDGRATIDPTGVVVLRR